MVQTNVVKKFEVQKSFGSKIFGYNTFRVKFCGDGLLAFDKNNNNNNYNHNHNFNGF